MILICSKTDQVSLWPNRMGPHLANAPNRNSLSKRADIDIFFITFLTIAPIRRLCRRRGCYAHDFSSKLSFFLAKSKTKIWHSFVCDVIIVKVQGGDPGPFNFFL